jgi:hypothetical protein
MFYIVTKEGKKFTGAISRSRFVDGVSIGGPLIYDYFNRKFEPLKRGGFEVARLDLSKEEIAEVGVIADSELMKKAHELQDYRNRGVGGRCFYGIKSYTWVRLSLGEDDIKIWWRVGDTSTRT